MMAQDGRVVVAKQGVFVVYVGIAAAGGDWFDEWQVFVDAVWVVRVTAVACAWDGDMRYMLHVDGE